MAINSGDEIDFSQDITSDDEGNIIMEPIGDDNDNNDDDNIDDDENNLDDDDNNDDNDDNNLDNDDDNNDDDSDDDNDEEDNDDNNTDDDDNDDNPDDGAFESFTATVNGQEISVDSAEEAQKIINNLSQPQLKQPDVWEQAQDKLGVTTKDLALVSAIKGGDDKALLFLAKQAGLDISQLIYDEAPDSFDADFTPTQKTEGELIMDNIQSSGEMEAFSQVLDSTDEDFVRNLSDVKNLNAFRQQVASGKAQELMPLAKKKALVENIPLFEAYALLGHEQKASKPETKVEKKITKKTPPKKKAKQAGKEADKGEETAEDIWGLSDEEFNKRFGGNKI